ncbi:MAG: hypothetical protein RMJ29_08295 [Candidatus Bipolaricaulota bacterium]|nr:hypothetical protein [Candidatus Bipolaricaulota bacterium]
MILWLIVGGLLLTVVGVFVLLLTQARLVWEPLTSPELEPYARLCALNPNKRWPFTARKGS